MPCNCIADVQAEREARVRAEGKLDGYREAMAQALAALARTQPAEDAGARPVLAVVPLAAQPRRHAGDAVTGAVTRPSVTAAREGRSPGAARTAKWREKMKGNQGVATVTVTAPHSVTRDASPDVTVMPPEEEKKSDSVSSLSSTSPEVTEGVTRHASRRGRKLAREDLPADVRELLDAWNAETREPLHRWVDTAAARLRRAQDALRRRPVDGPRGWRAVFGLVQRAPACRGEVYPRWRASVDWVLAPAQGEKEEPALRLLEGGMQTDPPPPPPAEPAPVEVLPAGDDAEDAAPARAVWRQVLSALREKGMRYALEWLELVRPVGIEDERLLLGVRDCYQRDWLHDHYAPLLEPVVQAQGLAGVGYVVLGGERGAA